MTERIGNEYERHMIHHWYMSCAQKTKTAKYNFVAKNWNEDVKCMGSCPSKSSVIRYIERLNENNVTDRRKFRRNDNLNTVCTDSNADLVELFISEVNGKISYSDLARMMNCDRKSITKMTKSRGYKQFNSVITGIVPPKNIPVRLHACNKWLEILRADPYFYRNVWFSDESHFDTLEELKTKILALHRPGLEVSGIQKERFPKRFTLWAAMHYEYGLIWYTDFFNDKGNYSNVNQFNYNDCLKYFFDTLKSRYSQEQIDKMWFSQDGASSHTAFINRAFIFSFFKERLIDRNSETTNTLGLYWPPFSCFLNPCDYTLWPVLKRPIRKRWLEYERDTDKMRAVTNEECSKLNLNHEYFRKSIDNFPERLAAVVWAKGDAVQLNDYRRFLKQNTENITTNVIV